MTQPGGVRVAAVCGGVGGAKLADGLLRVLPPDCLGVIVNTGDDFEHLGLHVSPDIDTVVYTLAGLANPDTGWGRRDESWSFMAALGALGGPTWFRLGDGDLAMHVERTRRLAAGEPLSAIVCDLARRLGIAARIVPMTDARLRTRVLSDEGAIDFQDYFVRRQCGPRVRGIAFDGAPACRPAPGVNELLRDPALGAIVICPSNPYLSIDPILAVPGLRESLRAARVPVVAVSPLIAGAAVKGPTAKIMAELGRPIGADEVARHYDDLIDGFVLDVRDAALAATIGVPVRLTDTLMKTPDDRRRVALECLRLAHDLAHGPSKEPSNDGAPDPSPDPLHDRSPDPLPDPLPGRSHAPAPRPDPMAAAAPGGERP
ncbi:MAG TPA: 2-phospho-L-lactate transferase [Rubrivivax sp.]|nr:2-phospho-L-lactate transferase [Rubrivivax sp.]